MGCNCSKDVEVENRNFDDLNEPAPTTRASPNAGVDKKTEKQLNKYANQGTLQQPHNQPAIMEEANDDDAPANHHDGRGGRTSYERPTTNGGGGDGHVVGGIGLTAPAVLTPSYESGNANGSTANNTTQPALPFGGGGGGRSRLVSQITTAKPKVEHPPMDEEEAKAAILRAEMRHEVTAARAGFGGDDIEEVEEAPKKPDAHIEIEEMQEFGNDDDDEKSAHDDQKLLNNATKSSSIGALSTTGGTFPSAEWMQANNLTPPNLQWWQDKAHVYIEVQITGVTDEEISMDGGILNYRGSVDGVRYGFVFQMQNPVQNNVKQSMENGKRLIEITKSTPQSWGNLLNADRKQIATLDWLRLDFHRTADSDEDEDDD